MRRETKAGIECVYKILYDVAYNGDPLELCARYTDYDDEEPTRKAFKRYAKTLSMYVQNDMEDEDLVTEFLNDNDLGESKEDKEDIEEDNEEDEKENEETN